MPPAFSAWLRCEGLMSEKWSAIYRKTNGLKLNAPQKSVESTTGLCDGNNFLATYCVSRRTTTSLGMSRSCQRRRLGHVDGSSGHISNYPTGSAPRQTSQFVLREVGWQTIG